ncbi:MAG: 2Fe-2S iron-sulfur cluster-binding protein [Bdellovibrionales bacterium]
MMPRISFVKTKAPLQVEVGANLMQALLEGGLPVASSCKGDGVCCKCVIQIVQGEANLSPRNDREQELSERNRLQDHVRVSCQTQVFGDITVDTGYW